MDSGLSFGQWLKRRRQGLGLTQRALGQRAGYSDETIRKVEAGAARPSRQMAERLAGTLSVAPEDWPRFVAFARDELHDASSLSTLSVVFQPEAAAEAPGAVPRHNLPVALTRFFGREREIEQVTSLLAENRLVTITGPAGAGKTRLALQVAEGALARYAQGVWLVEMASVTNPALVTEAVALALNTRKVPARTVLETLTHYLHDEQRLVVLDNCEHVLDACAWLVDGLLRACPRLTLLATSRQPLAVSGELVYVAPALDLPQAGRPLSPEAAGASPAMRLFVDRARLVRPDYQITAENAAWMAQVCQRLDGLPLAIEMAAARMNQISVEQLAGRLDDVFGVLSHGSRAAAPRQHTMRATLDWSYNLLSQPERLLLRRLAVFAGGCTLEAAEAVCAGEGLPAGRVLETLAALVTKSMVIADQRPGAEPRYRLLDIVRQYAQIAPTDAADEQPVGQCHFDYFLRWAETNGPQLYYKHRMAWLAKFETEHSNLRAALAWGFAHGADPAAGPRLTLAMHPYWYRHAIAEAQEWFQKARARCQSAALDPALTAQVLICSSTYMAGYATPQAVEMARHGLALSRALGPDGQEVLVQALIQFCFLASSPIIYLQTPGLLDQAAPALDELCAQMAQFGPGTTLDPRFYRARLAELQALVHLARGAHAAAQAAAQESERWFVEFGHEDNLVWTYEIQGDIALAAGAAGQARDHYVQALRLAIPYHHMFHGNVLAALCTVSLRLNDLAEALRWCQDYIRLAYAKDTPWNVAERLEMMAKIFAQLGRATLASRFSGAAEALSEKSGRKVSSEASREANYGDWTTRYADVSLDALVPNWRARPEAAALQQAWQAGRTLSYEQVVAEALAAGLDAAE